MPHGNNKRDVNLGRKNNTFYDCIVFVYELHRTPHHRKRTIHRNVNKS